MGKNTAEPRGASAADSPWPKPLYSWYVVGVLMLAYTNSFIDRKLRPGAELPGEAPLKRRMPVPSQS
jgi:hypothetical protein